MNKSSLLVSVLAGLTFAGCARAQCLTVDNLTLPSAYNPFSATGMDQTATINIRRGGIFQSLQGNLVFLRRPGDNRNYDIKVVSDDGSGSGSSVLYYPPGPALSTGNNDAGEIDVNFLIFSDRTAQVRFILPAQTDLPAGTQDLVLDVKFLCEELFGNSSGTTPLGFTARLNVLSALQASFVGSSLDFSEIGAISTSNLPATPESVKRVTGALRVASSGPYEIKATSKNGWVMTPNGGAASLAREKIGYEMQLVGRTVRPGSSFIPKICSRAGINGVYLPISVTLVEGGVGKTPSPTYQDTITVTVTPLGATTPAPDGCP